jgi:murein DD-endopeptidase MepM/ murein hydrolase activator NlpD
LRRMNFRRGWLNLLVSVQKWLMQIRRKGRALLRSARPFLAPRFWIIYLCAFAAGFYLWGPAQGLRKIQTWRANMAQSTDRSSVDTLQKEVERLKKELKLQQRPQTGARFQPENFSRPALGQVIQGFDWVSADHAWRLHSGVDLAVPEGTSVMAAAEGTVAAVTKTAGGTYSVTLSHGNDWESVYSGLGSVLVHEGEKVIKGVVLGTSGRSGCYSEQPSFHFGLYHEKQPVDPAKIIGGL